MDGGFTTIKASVKPVKSVGQRIMNILTNYTFNCITYIIFIRVGNGRYKSSIFFISHSVVKKKGLYIKKVSSALTDMMSPKG